MQMILLNFSEVWAERMVIWGRFFENYFSFWLPLPRKTLFNAAISQALILRRDDCGGGLFAVFGV